MKVWILLSVSRISICLLTYHDEVNSPSMSNDTPFMIGEIGIRCVYCSPNDFTSLYLLVMSQRTFEAEIASHFPLFCISIGTNSPSIVICYLVFELHRRSVQSVCLDVSVLEPRRTLMLERGLHSTQYE